MYKESIEDNEGFWGKHGRRIDWIKPYTKIRSSRYSKVDTQIKWYYDGTLNASYNCIDRHINKGHGTRTAIIWEGNNPSHDLQISYNDLLVHTCQLANGLKSLGVRRGDRVTIYMPMIP